MLVIARRAYQVARGMLDPGLRRGENDTPGGVVVLILFLTNPDRSDRN